MQELGKYSLDMSKLIFGGVILAGIMNLGVEAIYLFGVGGTLVAFFAVIGFVFLFKIKIDYGFYLFLNCDRGSCFDCIHRNYVV